jgi:hypothetical protein
MAHLVFIEDDKGDVIDHIVYCSDFCAKSHPDYAGWNGCHEIPFGERCHCGQAVAGIEDEEA